MNRRKPAGQDAVGALMNDRSDPAMDLVYCSADIRESTADGRSAGATTGNIPIDGYEAAAPGSAGAMPAVFGRYRVEGLLGRGGMSSVYLAHDELLGRPVALKIPRIAASHSGRVLARLRREARSVAALQHPNICPIYDVGEFDGIHYLAMAYIKGRSLAEYLKSARPQSERAAVLTVLKIAKALEEAHRQEILHRDLKPANIMIDVRGEPIVMDFGLACHLEDDQAHLSQEDLMVGTPAYMSPEQIDHRAPIGPASDIYSLGVVLYELLTQRCPFQGSVLSVTGQSLHSEPPAIESLRENVSPQLAEICRKAMAKNPAERFGSMQELADALSAFIRGKQADAAACAPAPELAAGGEQLVVAPPAENPSPAQAGPRPAGFELSPRLVGIVVTSAAAALLGIGLLIYANRAAWPVVAETNRETTASPSTPAAPLAAPNTAAVPNTAAAPNTAATSNQTETPPPAASLPVTTPPRPRAAPPPEGEHFGPPPPFHGGPPPVEAFRGKTVEEGFARLDRNGDGVVTPRELPLHIIWRGDENDDDAIDLAEMRVAYARHEEGLFAVPTELELTFLPPPPPPGPHPWWPRRSPAAAWTFSGTTTMVKSLTAAAA
jgi:predicted Ser/Thr protein kinase